MIVVRGPNHVSASQKALPLPNYTSARLSLLSIVVSMKGRQCNASRTSLFS
jgi:hypothetical protein